MRLASLAAVGPPLLNMESWPSGLRRLSRKQEDESFVGSNPTLSATNCSKQWISNGFRHGARRLANSEVDQPQPGALTDMNMLNSILLRLCTNFSLKRLKKKRYSTINIYISYISVKSGYESCMRVSKQALGLQRGFIVFSNAKN